MSDTPSIVSIDSTVPYLGLRPVVVSNVSRPGGAWEVLGALARLLGEVIAAAPTPELRQVLEEDAHLVIKKYILITPEASPLQVTLTDLGPSDLSH